MGEGYSWNLRVLPEKLLDIYLKKKKALKCLVLSNYLNGMRLYRI